MKIEKKISLLDFFYLTYTAFCQKLKKFVAWQQIA